MADAIPPVQLGKPVTECIVGMWIRLVARNRYRNPFGPENRLFWAGTTLKTGIQARRAALPGRRS